VGDQPFPGPGLYIVNGRLRGDSYGRYTYSSSLQIISLSLTSTQSLSECLVGPLTPLSDHSKITVYLNRAILNHKASRPKKLNRFKKCYSWKECSVETNQKTMRQQQFQSLQDNFLGKTFHCNSEGVNLVVENLNSIFDLSASLSNLKMSSREPKKMKNNDKMV
jgi:hypothetical protein